MIYDYYFIDIIFFHLYTELYWDLFNDNIELIENKMIFNHEIQKYMIFNVSHLFYLNQNFFLLNYIEIRKNIRLHIFWYENWFNVFFNWKNLRFDSFIEYFDHVNIYKCIKFLDQICSFIINFLKKIIIELYYSNIRNIYNKLNRKD